ncbi:MAG: hypothetical protein VYD64_03260, partial [Pseudomonadota bacterium]|nr:hypothetical protein [Pseudomonadota bacterium]
DDQANVPALKGWRRELFGEEALKLKNGQIAIGFDGKSVSIIPVSTGRTGPDMTLAARQSMPL